MEEPIVVGIDVGTSKICTLVARVEGERTLRILGVGIEPAQGIKKGTVVDIAAATQSIARSVEKAERSSGLEITSAIVSLAGSHVSSVNSRGVVGIAGRVIDHNDVTRALEISPGCGHPPQPRNYPCDPAQFHCGWTRWHSHADWYAWFPFGSGSPYYHRSGCDR